jgi:hypothetical protein
MMAQPISPTLSRENEIKRGNAYIFSNDLAVIPLAIEENVASVIHSVSDINHAIDMKWPPEFCLLDFDGVDLQGGFGPSIDGGIVCTDHGTQLRCIRHPSKQSVC